MNTIAMTEQTESTKQITLLSSDDVNVCVPRNAAIFSEYISNALALDDEEEEPEEDYTTVKCQRITSKTLEHVVQFLTLYRDTPMQAISDPRVNVIAAEFEENVPQQIFRDYISGLGLETLWQVRSAANFLGIESLNQLTNVWLVFYLMDKTVDEIHDILCIPRMTAEQEEKARAEHPWLFEVYEKAEDKKPDDAEEAVTALPFVGTDVDAGGDY